MNLDLVNLLNLANDATLTPEQALTTLADLVNESGDARRLDGIEVALRLGERLRATTLGESDQALLHYFTANAHAIRRSLSQPQMAADLWGDLDLEEEIRHLRLALQSRGFSELHPYQQCQVLTNLGNALSHCGRLVEALEWYDRALVIDPSFGMAVANRGLTMVSYANHVHEPSRRTVFVRAARAQLARALELDLEEGASDLAKAALARLESRAPTGFSWEVRQPTGTLEGRSTEDRQFREWGLKHRLFLNELNDLGDLPMGARDALSLPGHVVPLGEGPRFIGFFNQIKQEFVAARWLFFEGSHPRAGHPADADVVLTDTMDYPSYSFATEQLRLAFRSAYSILDKVGFFLNHYLHLGMRDQDVAFRTLWFTGHKSEKRLRPGVAQRLSKPLRAMIWISQDLFDPNSEYGAALLPDAADLWEIRRCLEHRYLKLHGDQWSEEWNASEFRNGLRDDLATSLTRSAFEDKTLRLLRMVRAVLMYLSWAMYVEEQSRRSKHPHAITPPMVLFPLPSQE